MNYNCYIFATGSELTSGKIIDTNSSWIAGELYSIGICVKKISVLSDNPNLIFEELKKIRDLNESSLIILTGGLGPTKDDFTLDVVCDLTGSKKEMCKFSYQKLDESFKVKQADRKNFEVALKQTFYPSLAHIFKNNLGIAPSFHISLSDKTSLFCMPGVPQEMKSIFRNSIKPYILENFVSSSLFQDSRFIWQISESNLQEDFLEKESLLKEDISWGVSVKRGYVEVIFYSKSKDLIKAAIEKIEVFYKERCTKDIFNFLPLFLLENKKTLATAESCTGGLLSKMITDRVGSSKYFFGSVVCYDNVVKEKVLNVRKQTLLHYGAVSEKTAEEMLFGIIDLFQVDVAVSITGIAGPGGETEDKKVGLAFIGVGSKTNYKVYKVFFPSDRAYFREYCSNLAYYFLYLYFQ